MSENIKIFIGFLVPAASIVSFFFSVFAENYILGMFLAIFGGISWLIFVLVAKFYWPKVTGNIIIVFGALLSLAVFLDSGLEQNMFGGLNFKPEGIAYSSILFFFSILLGVLFKNISLGVSDPTPQKSYREPSASANDETVFDLKEADNNVDPLTNNSDKESDYLSSLEEYYPGYEEYFREYYDE